MDLRDYLSLFRRWWWLIAGTSVAVAVAALIITPVPAQRYAATTKVLISQGSSGLPDADTVVRGQRIADTYGELLLTRPVLEQTIANVGLSDSPEALAGRVSVVNPPDTNLLEITVVDTSPDRAALTANTIVDVFIVQNASVQSSRYATSRENLQREIDDIVVSIEDERNQVDLLQIEINRLQNRVEALNAREVTQGALTAEQIAERSGLETDINDKIVERNEIDTQLNRDEIRYQTLLQSFEEVRLLEAQATDFLTVVENAPPGRAIGSGSGKVVAALQGLLGGAVVAAGVVALIEYLRVTIRTPDEAARITNLPPLGAISEIGGASPAERLLLNGGARSFVAEAYRVLRTNLDVMESGEPVRTLVVTSGSPQEGKSTTAANLAVVMAQSGKRVILVDADLRRPAIHKLFQKPNKRGVTTALLRDGGASVEAHLLDTELPTLRLLTSGPLPPNPADLLGSARMAELVAEMRGLADVVIFDTAPLLAVADAMLLGRTCDGALLVILAGKTRGDALKQVMQLSRQAGLNILGTVLNRLTSGGGGYYYYDSYYYGERGKGRE